MRQNSGFLSLFVECANEIRQRFRGMVSPFWRKRPSGIETGRQRQSEGEREGRKERQGGERDRAKERGRLRQRDKGRERER